MSYCRWSSDDYACDVYVYADVAGGWTTHVASGRYQIDRSTLPPRAGTKDGVFDTDAWMKRYEALSALIDGAPVVSIGLPHDGQSFSDPTPGACADRLESLRALGYVVPQSAIDALREEHMDTHPETTNG